ncbi:hypothetical protein ACLIMP_05565 [Novosphingobium aerophilum]|uniref:hypothetical protein n=1 Tax=Novosphingobium TaxID=165696 RepID=UPI002D7872E6|nr:hypothetical protein [Novosphingobium sp. RL4]WRT93704.1 hypothetical protein U9J33_04110 [Novosphingobium sp. RL4]
MIPWGGDRAPGSRQDGIGLTVAVDELRPAASDDGVRRFEMSGTVAGDLPFLSWDTLGAEVAIFVNRAGTAFGQDGAVIGNGRLYEDRIEIDLVLDRAAAGELAASVEGPGGKAIWLNAEPVTETIFRILSVGKG